MAPASIEDAELELEEIAGLNGRVRRGCSSWSRPAAAARTERRSSGTTSLMSVPSQDQRWQRHVRLHAPVHA